MQSRLVHSLLLLFLALLHHSRTQRIDPILAGESAADIDDLDEPFGEGRAAESNLEVVLERVGCRCRRGMPQSELEQRLQLALRGVLPLLAEFVLGEVEEVREGVAVVDEEVLFDGPVEARGQR